MPDIDDFNNSKLLMFQEIDNELHNRLQDCQTRLNNRNNLLTLCKARVEYDKNAYRKAPDCTSEERDTRVAKAALDAARNNVNSMNDFKRQVADLMAAHNEKSVRYKKANTSFSQSCIDETRFQEIKIYNYIFSIETNMKPAKKKLILL